MPAAGPLKRVKSLGDGDAPFADEVIDSDRRRFSRTRLAAGSRPDLVSALQRLVAHRPRRVLPVHDVRTSGTGTVLLGEIPSGEPLSVHFKRHSLVMDEVRAIGAQLFEALDALHPSNERGAPNAALVHGRVRPETVVWDPYRGALTLVGLSNVDVPGGPLQLFSGEGRDEYLPLDAHALGADPSVDVFAACTVLDQALILCEGTVMHAPSVVDFMQRGRHAEARHRFQSAAQAGHAWDAAMAAARRGVVPPAWHELEEEIYEVALLLQVEPEAADCVATARTLVRHGLLPSSLRIVQTLAEVRHDTRGEDARFAQMAGEVQANLRLLRAGVS